ncbi:hypothetical protein GBA52_023352 [Prunus armeniaca]|nr:hypothetical protein GBA52_023352 [Prunus armeniaca]
MFSLNDLKDQMPTTPSALLSAYASFTAFMMLVRSMANELIPAPLRSYIYKAINYIVAPFFSVEFTLLIDQYFGMTRNQVYDAAERKKAESEKKKLLIKNKKPGGRKGITKLLRFIFPAMHYDA